MVDMLAWPDRPADVLDDLVLDPRNVRLDVSVEAPQVDIMRDLFANERVLSLVEGIAKVGYLTHETPVVIQRDDQLVVVEGNRRIAALKAIQNPFLASEYQSRVSSIASRIPDRDGLRRIIVKVAPSQAEADQIVAAIHTANLRIPWTPARQAAFFQAQVDAGGTLPELTARYPTADVRRFVFRSLVLNRFRSVRYSKPELNDYVRKRSFPVSTLARIYESARFIQLLGLKMNTAGRLSSEVSQRTFSEIAEFIIDGMNEGAYSTRTLNTTESPTYKALLEQIAQIVAAADHGSKPKQPNRGTSTIGSDSDAEPETGERPATSNSSSTVGGNGSGANDRTTDKDTDDSTRSGTSSSSDKGSGRKAQQSNGLNNAEQEKGRTPPRSAQRVKRMNLQIGNLSIPNSYPNAINYSFAELASINVVRYPNATLDLIRSFLEKVIKAYAGLQGSRIQAGPGGQVQLSQCLLWLEDHVGGIQNRSLVPVIKKLQSGKIREYATSAMYLNDLNHNENVFAVPDEVHGVWDSMDGLLRLMLK